jgi:general stress protein 26
MARTVTPFEYKDNIKTLGELIKDIRFAMLVTVDDENQLRSRPMATQQVEFDGDLWFFTHVDDPKVDETEEYQQVNLSYAAPDKNTYISVSGKATVSRDKNKMEELWHLFLKAWFPDGLDDPKLALLKVTVEEAEYWDAPAGAQGMVATAIGFVQMLVTGEQAEIGENEKLKFT